MNIDPMVSVIIPVYNAEKFLISCIESVIQQTYKNIEVILINDGSTDKSGDLCDEFSKRDSRVKVIHQKNMGPSFSRNIGLKSARGKFIQFVDSDDFIDQSMIDRLLAETGNDIDLVLCGYRLVKKEKQNKSDYRCPNIEKTYVKKDFLKDFGRLYKEKLINSPCNKLYTAKVIKEASLQFPESISMGEDLIFNLDYLNSCTGKVSVITDVLYNYVLQSSDSLTRNYKENYFAIQKRLHISVQEFLKNQKIYEENEKMVELKFSRIIVDSINNLFHPKSNLLNKDIKREIASIIFDDHVLQNSESLKRRNKKLSLSAYLIEKKAVFILFHFFKLRYTLKLVLGKSF